MKVQSRYIPFFVSALLLIVAVALLYPHYKYYVDPDGTAYLTIAWRYASGDFAKAINGYWSPWACWLSAVFIKLGMGAIAAGTVVNTMGAVGFLLVTTSFFRRFSIAQSLHWALSIATALFLCYAVFWQSFDDLWECFFLLGALRLLIIDDFIHLPLAWVAYGILGALAYFAKAYSFPFFILATACCVFFMTIGDRAKWLQICATSIGVMLLCSLPWIIALHSKYGIWTTSTSGSLNMSWYLVGHPEWKSNIGLLIPPAYPDSPYYWEDPYMANGNTPHFWNSFALFGRQLLRIGLNVWKFVVSSLQLSVFFVLVYSAFTVIVIQTLIHARKTGFIKPANDFIIGLSAALFPLGYVLVNFESRYIWYMVPITMVMGALHIQDIDNRLQKIALTILFSLSFLVYPAWCMVGMFGEGAKEYDVAQQLRKRHITGSFTSMAQPGKEVQRIERLAYFSGNAFYSHSKPGATVKEVLPEMRRYNILYLYSYQSTNSTEHFVDESGVALPEITNGTISGLKIYLLRAK